MAKSNAPVVTYNMPKCACNPGGTPNDFAWATSMLFSMHRFAHEDHFHFVDNIDIPPFDNYPSYREALALGTQPITTRQIATPAMILTFLYPYKIGVTAQAAKHGFQSLQLNYSPLHEWLNQALYH